MTDIFPKKTYLNGSDCFHLMMEHNRQLVKEGNNQIVYCIEFQNEEGLRKIIDKIQDSPFLYWLNNCKIVEPQIGVPYLLKTKSDKEVLIEPYGEVNEQFPHVLLNKTLQIKQHQFFQFYTYQFQSNHFLMIALHHVLFDGKGAGLFIEHIKGDLIFTPENIRQFFPKRLKWKNAWSQWKNLIYVKKTVERTNKGKTAYLKKEFLDETGFSLLTHKFSENEMNLIQENAKQNGVRFGINLYQIACICKVFRELLTEENEIWLPVPYNGRKRGSKGTIISNYTSFIFHRLKVDEYTTIAEIVSQLQAQMNAQIADELPTKYNNLLQLMRFFPTWFNHLVTTKSSKGNIASFLYSSTEMQEQKNESDFKNEWIIPPFSFPPGLTINFHSQNKFLNFNIVYSNIVLDHEKAMQLKKRLISQMLETN